MCIHYAFLLGTYRRISRTQRQNLHNVVERTIVARCAITDLPEQTDISNQWTRCSSIWRLGVYPQRQEHPPSVRPVARRLRTTTWGWCIQWGCASNMPVGRSRLRDSEAQTCRSRRRRMARQHRHVRRVLDGCTPVYTMSGVHGRTQEEKYLAELHDEVHQRPSRISITDVSRLFEQICNGDIGQQRSVQCALSGTKVDVDVFLNLAQRGCQRWRRESVTQQ